MNRAAIHSGYLVLADLSGFTPFVASTEVDHAQGILSNLLGLLRRALTPTLRLAEVEGDALFLFASAQALARGETLLELIESTYVDFRDKLKTMRRNATCPCEACRMIPSLDLKFVTHFGEYVLQDMTGTAKPFGSCVNLAHRLLKNDVSENTGWQAYALFTDRALDRMGVSPEGMHTQRLSYPHLGDLTIGAVDLRARYEELIAQRTSFLGSEEAHFTVRRRYDVPPARLWEYVTDANVRNGWEVGSEWAVATRPAGRSGPGASNHCSASGFTEQVLDWRPFRYYTVQLRYGRLRFRVTGELAPDGEGTELQWRIALESLLPTAIRGPACRFLAKRLMRAELRFERLQRMIEADGHPGHAAPA